jgi:hypothetical protein
MNNQTSDTEDQVGEIEPGGIIGIVFGSILLFFIIFLCVGCYSRINVYRKTIIRKYIRKDDSINKPILIIHEDDDFSPEFESPNLMKNAIIVTEEEKVDCI